VLSCNSFQAVKAAKLPAALKESKSPDKARELGWIG